MGIDSHQGQSALTVSLFPLLRFSVDVVGGVGDNGDSLPKYSTGKSKQREKKTIKNNKNNIRVWNCDNLIATFWLSSTFGLLAQWLNGLIAYWHYWRHTNMPQKKKTTKMSRGNQRKMGLWVQTENGTFLSISLCLTHTISLTHSLFRFNWTTFGFLLNLFSVVFSIWIKWNSCAE